MTSSGRPFRASRAIHTTRATATPIAAKSVKVNTPRPAPATVSRNGHTPPSKPAVSSDSGRRQGAGKVSHAATAAAAQAWAATASTAELLATLNKPTPTAAASAQPASSTTPTAYPGFWSRAVGRGSAGAGAGHQPATISAARAVRPIAAASAALVAPQPHQQPPQRAPQAASVHATGDTGRLIRAQQQRESAQIATAQAARTSSMYNRSNLIAAAGGNAARMRAAEQAELDRMARERSARYGA